MQKPEKYPRPAKISWGEYLTRLAKPIMGLVAAVLQRMGWWYCFGCDKIHGPRVVKYLRWMNTKEEGEVGVYLCSLHKAPKDERVEL
jgi:hypothetical protein